MSENGKRSAERIEEQPRVRRQAMLNDQSSPILAAHSLPDHDPEFYARWPFLSPRPSLNCWSSGGRPCPGANGRENLSQDNLQKPVSEGAESERNSSAFQLNDNPFESPSPSVWKSSIVASPNAKKDSSSMPESEEVDKQCGVDASPSSLCNAGHSHHSGTKEAMAMPPIVADHPEKTMCTADPQNDKPCSALTIGLTEMADMSVDPGSDLDEAESPASVRVGKYIVIESLAPTLRKVMDKYGDIAAQYLLEASGNRSFALEKVCQIIQAFERKRLCEFTQSEIEMELAYVRDFVKAGLRIGWLQERLEDILGARLLLKQSVGLKLERDRKDKLVKDMQKKVMELKEKMSLAEQELEAAKAEAKRTREAIKMAVKKVDFYLRNPLLDKLL